MSKNYDLIATVSIDISSPIVDDASFDNILIVGPAPAKEGYTAEDVGVYNSLTEVTDAGFVATGDNPDPVGVAAMVAFSQSPRPTAVYIAIQKTVDGEVEEPTDTVARALATSGWYVICPAGIASDKLEALAAYVESTEKMCVYTEMDFFTNKKKASVGSTYFRTAGIFGRESSNEADSDVPAANNYMNVAFAIKWLYYDSGSETAAFKTLSSVYPSNLTSTEMKALAEANLNYYITVGNKNLSMNGKVIGDEWMDVIRFRDWLKNDMQVRVVNQFVMNPKIPYTDGGIALIQNQMLASLKAGQDAGGIAPTEYDEDGNEIVGYVTSVPLSSSLTASEKASRKLTKCKFKARLAGAIHFAELEGSLTYEL